MADTHGQEKEKTVVQSRISSQDETVVSASAADEDTSVNLQQIPDHRKCPTCGLHVSIKTTKCPSDGTVLVDEPISGNMLAGRYQFVERLAEGGMGAVYKVRHQHLNQYFAIKVLHAHLNDEIALKRFMREAKTTLALRHRGICAVHDFGISEHGQAFIIMDFVEGITLQQQVRQHGPLSREQAIDVFEQLCDALHYAHSQGVVHRDIKPSNVMLESARDGRLQVRILDFGIAKLRNSEGADTTLTETGEIIGSPLFMSPEQCTGQQPDERSDIYSLGCTLFEAVTGRPPFRADTAMQTIMMHLNEEPPLLHEVSDNESIYCFDEVLQKSMAKDPAARYQSLMEFSSALSTSKRSTGRPAPVEEALPVKAAKEGFRLVMHRPYMLLGAMGAMAFVFYFAMTNSPRLEYSVSKPNSTIPAGTSSSNSLSANSPSADFLSANSTSANSTSGNPYPSSSQGEIEFQSALQSAKSSGKLTLANARIDDARWKQIATLSGLKDVDLSHAVFDPTRLKQLPTASLISLDVSSTDTADADLAFLADTGIHTLRTMNCPKVHGQIISLLPASITELDMDGSTLDCTPPPDFTRFPKLDLLSLEAKAVTDDWCRDLYRLKHLKNLRISRTSISDQSLEYLSRATQLGFLSVSGTGITDSGLKFIGNIRTLENLHLNDTNIDGSGLKYLTRLPLRELYLARSKVTDDSMRYVAQMRNLHTLVLKGTAISAAGLDRLKSLKALGEVQVAGCPNITAETISRYRPIMHAFIDTTR